MLNDIVNNYNTTKHAGILNTTPLDVHMMTKPVEILEFSSELYKNKCKQIKKISPLLERGQRVRLKSAVSSQSKFTRGYFTQNTYGIFKISEINKEFIPVTYKIKSLDGEDIVGSFYRSELVPCKDSGLYDVTILKTRRRKNKKEYMIKFINYPESQPKWVTQADLKKIR